MTIPNGTPIELALRCFPVLANQKPTRKRQRRRWKPPEYLLVYDPETTTDARQQLTAGSYHCYRRIEDADDRFTYECFEEGLFHADNAPADAVARLRAYAEAHTADTSVENPKLRVLSQREFVDLLYLAAVKARAHVVNFNMPFDVSRLAFKVGEARKGARGGFSLVLSAYRDPKTGELRENVYRPRLTVKTIDSKRAFKQFTRVKDDLQGITDSGPRRGIFRGNLLDLRTLGFALTDRGLSLDSACKEFGVERKGDPGRHLGWGFDDEYIDYNRRDTRITAKLGIAMLREYGQHPINVPPGEVYSPASIAKGYLAAMGVTPPLLRWPDFTKPELGYTMSTFYGGRTSARIRRFLVPVRYCDFQSMYPTVIALLRLWDLLIAADYSIVDVTNRAQALLDGMTLEQLFDPTTWEQLSFFAQIVPRSDILPARAHWDAGDARQIGVNPLTATDPLWFAGPDLVGSVLMAKRAPRIVRAFAIEPVRDEYGRVVPLKKLRTVNLLGSIPVDPVHDNFFLKAIEMRQRARNDATLSEAERGRRNRGLKVIANSAYGNLAQMDDVDLPEGESAEVEVFGAIDSFVTRTTKPEKLGEYFFPPIAAQITAGARCMLAMLERCVTDRGGTYAMEDTDSMAIVATPEGGLVPCLGGPHSLVGGRPAPNKPLLKLSKGAAIRALSFAEVDSIVARFAPLNPYSREAVPGSILKIENVNFDDQGKPRQVWCYAISSKRYALFALDERGEPHITEQYSEHGLGHLLNPIDVDSQDRSWIPQIWETIAREHLGLPTEEPPWLGRPALTQLAITTPRLLRPFAANEAGLDYADRMKPFNFLLAAHVAPLGFPSGTDPSRFLLIAPFESDPALWRKLTWSDVHSERPFAITTDPTHRVYHPEKALVQTYRDALALFRLHPEPKSLRPDGLPCDELHKDCAGLLQRRPAFVSTGAIEYVGKEMNELDDVLAGIAHDEDAIVTRYRDPRRLPFDQYRVLLRAIPKRDLMTLTGLSERCIERARRGNGAPHPRNRARLLQAVIIYFSGHPLPTFETIERLDPEGIAAEIRAGAKSRTSSQARGHVHDPGRRVRENVGAAYTQRLQVAIGLLGL
jgi:hypothetical protein